MPERTRTLWALTLAALLLLTVMLPAAAREVDAADTTTEKVWYRQFGTSANDTPTGIAVDAKGNAYVVGYTFGAFKGQRNRGEDDTFLRKYSSSGQVRWTRQYGTTSYDTGDDVAATPDGRVYVLSWDSRNQVMLLRKYRPDGKLRWIKKSGIFAGESVAVDGLGRPYVVGLSRYTNQAFIRAYTSAGKVRWTREFGDRTVGDHSWPTEDEAFGVAADRTGAVYVVGETAGAIPGQTSRGRTDAFIRKYTAAGAHLWTRQFGTPRGERAWDVATAPSGEVAVVGMTSGVFSGQPGTPGNDYGFVRAYSADGTTLWTRQYPAEVYGLGNAIAVDGRGLIHVADDRGSAAVLRTYDLAGVKVSTGWLKATVGAASTGVAIGPYNTIYLAGEVTGRLPGRRSKGGADGFIGKYRVR